MKISRDNITKKFLVRIDEDTYVETTYVDYENKHIVCFSSMAGCPVGCEFCVSNQNEAYRRLTVAEMLIQCAVALKDVDTSSKPILFSCMGEGEPFLNYKSVIHTLKELAVKYPNSKLAMSTTCVKPHILEYLAKEEFDVPFKLQISIHSMTDYVRKKLMPLAPPISTIDEYLPIYQDSGKDLEFNYVLLDGINDGVDDAIRLAAFANGIKIKLNMLNPIPNSPFQFTTQFDRFCEELDSMGANYEFYATNGADINAACGQLSYKERRQ